MEHQLMWPRDKEGELPLVEGSMLLRRGNVCSLCFAAADGQSDVVDLPLVLDTTPPRPMNCLIFSAIAAEEWEREGLSCDFYLLNDRKTPARDGEAEDAYANAARWREWGRKYQ